MGWDQKKIRHGQLTWDCKCLEAEGNDRTREHLLNIWSFQTFPLATPILCMISSSHPTAAVVKKAQSSRVLQCKCHFLLQWLRLADTQTTYTLWHILVPGLIHYLNYLLDILSVWKSWNFHSLYQSSNFLMWAEAVLRATCHAFLYSEGCHRHQRGCNVADTPKSYWSSRTCFRESSLPDTQQM